MTRGKGGWPFSLPPVGDKKKRLTLGTAQERRRNLSWKFTVTSCARGKGGKTDVL